MRAETILFDLDGTLTNPGLGITNSILYALGEMGRDTPPRESLYRFIGPPLRESFEKFCGMNEAESAEALRLYRVYFAERGLFENEVYPGVPAMLAALRDAGVTLLLATSKPEIYARRILAHFSLSEYFVFAGGSELSGERVRKADVIAYSLAKAGISRAADRRDIWMVGDRLHDIEGAREHGIPAVGVLWGYGSAEELTAAGASVLVDSPEDLTKQMLAG